jgi:hypothetical protein
MFALIVFAAVMVLLGVLAGSGYSPSWASRWDTSSR